MYGSFFGLSRAKLSINDESELGIITNGIAAYDGVSNATFLTTRRAHYEGANTSVFTTYTQDWHKHYLDQQYWLTDPVVVAATKTVLPFDWQEIPQDDKITRQFMGESREFGVGVFGVSVPVRGPNGEMGLFSVNSDLSANDWYNFKYEHLNDIYMVAGKLQQAFADLHSPKFDVGDLSPQELRVLRWYSEGKNSWEIAKIMMLSPETIKTYSKQIRRKMDVTSMSQAIAVVSNLKL